MWQPGPKIALNCNLEAYLEPFGDLGPEMALNWILEAHSEPFGNLAQKPL